MSASLHLARNLIVSTAEPLDNLRKVKQFPVAPKSPSLPNGRDHRSVRRTLVVPAAASTTTQTVEAASGATERDVEVVGRSMPPKYDPLKLKVFFSKRPVTVIKRTYEVSLKLGKFGFSLWSDWNRGVLEDNEQKRAQQLTKIISELGPAFVKVGQALSTRPDLVPKIYIEELSVLQDSIPTFPTSIAYKCIEDELGAPLEQLYKSITPEPIASASLGQVYRATLYSGEEVAIKVQRPCVLEGIALDFFIVRNLADAVQPLLPTRTSARSIVDEFAFRVFGELDYIQEGHNADKFRRMYMNRQKIKVPSVYWDRTSTKVLTTEWISGVKLTEFDSIRANGYSVVGLVDAGIQCSLRQLLDAGFFHADPHPGNLLATADGQLAYLDFGMMSEVPNGARYAIINHIVHLVNRDFEAMAQDYYELEFLDRSVDVKPIVPALESFFGDVLDASVTDLNFKRLVDGLGQLFFKFPFDVPAYYALILRSLTVLEGIAMAADPSFKVIAAAYPYVASRLLTDPAPQLRQAFIELLFKDKRFRWKRLENLLRESSKSSDYRFSSALRPLLKLILSTDESNAEIRNLVEKEAVRVAEALTLGNLVASVQGDGAGEDSMPSAFSAAVPDLEEMMTFREQLFSIWGFITTDNESEEPSSEAGQLNFLRVPQIPTPFSPAIVNIANTLTEDEALRADLQSFLYSVSNKAAERVAARGVQFIFLGNTPARVQTAQI